MILKPDYAFTCSDPESGLFYIQTCVLMSQHPNTPCSFCLHPPTDWGSVAAATESLLAYFALGASKASYHEGDPQTLQVEQK